MQTIKGNLDSLGPKGQYSAPVEQPEILEIDCTKAKSVEELGLLLNALGLGMTADFAKNNNLEHLLVAKK